MHFSKDITTLQRQHNIVRNVARRGLIKFVLVAMYVAEMVVSVGFSMKLTDFARCRLAYGPADATATHCLLLQ